MVQKDMQLTSLLPMAPVQYTPSDGTVYIYSRSPLIQINWNGEPSRYAESTDNWIFL
jgi:hypothetical protein